MRLGIIHYFKVNKINTIREKHVSSKKTDLYSYVRREEGEPSGSQILSCFLRLTLLSPFLM